MLRLMAIAIAVGSILILLTGCASHKNAPAVKRAVNACQLHCSKQLNACSQQCDHDCQQCEAAADASSARHYHRFVHQQCVQGGLIARELKSYRDPLQCRKMTCNCRADYHLCTEACTGMIHKRLQSPMTCC